MTISSGDISDSFKADVNSRLPDSATSINDFIIFNFYLNSLEYQRIHNFPQHGMQFIAEVRFKPNNTVWHQIAWPDP